MIKVLAAARRHPDNRSLADFHRYWAHTHGPLFANTAAVRRYVQHLTLPDAYGGRPAPTFDGVSIFWYDTAPTRRSVAADPEIAALLRAVLGFTPPAPDAAAPPPTEEEQRQARLGAAVARDDAQLFDRSTEWPMHGRRAYVIAQERPILDAPGAPDMVKIVVVCSRLPGLALAEFCAQWQQVHGPTVARLPGLRRYVQNHPVSAGYELGGQTHDGWSELWFDDLASAHQAAASPQWRAAAEAGAELFAAPAGVVVAPEGVQKDTGWAYRDWGVSTMTDDQIRTRLSRDGYRELADDPDAPARLRAAAADQALAVWTDEHLVTIDTSDIDARPGQAGPLGIT